MDRVTGDVVTRDNGKLRAYVLVDGNEVNHMWFNKNEKKKAGEWLVSAKKLASDEVYQNHLEQRR